jgi:hypothetical protein
MIFEKNYYFKIDEEEIWFWKIMLDENKNAYPGYETQKLGLESNPTILDITSLGYIPSRGSVYDEKIFKVDGIDNKTLNVQKVNMPCGEHTTFAFLVDNVVMACMSWCNDTIPGTYLVPLAKSNPKIIYREVQVQ